MIGIHTDSTNVTYYSSINMMLEMKVT